MLLLNHHYEPIPPDSSFSSCSSCSPKNTCIWGAHYYCHTRILLNKTWGLRSGPSGKQYKTPRFVKFGMEHPLAHWLWFRKKTIWRTMWGPCLGHKRATLWPFLGEGATGFSQQSEIWHGASLGTLIRIQRTHLKDQVRTNFCHKRAIFLQFLGKGDYGIHPEFWNLAWSIPGHIDYQSGSTNLRDYVWAIKG